jgi:hypothetical protein
MKALWWYAGPRLIVGAFVIVLLGIASIISAFPHKDRLVVLLVLATLCVGVALVVRVLVKRRNADQD